MILQTSIRAQAILGQIFLNDKNGLMARFQVTVVLPSKADREQIRNLGQQTEKNL